MYWQVRTVKDSSEEHAPSGRFALHRAGDGQVDLRIEMDGYLMGWRVDGDALVETAWATEKAPHPVDWIDTVAGRLDHGTYAWVDRGDDRRALVLRGENESRVVAFERVEKFSMADARAIAECVDEVGADISNVPAVIADGATARRRAIARFTGLGRELDGDAFDGAVWTRALEGLSLDEIHRQLGVLEARFDAKYPPMRTSVAEALGDGAEASVDAMEILRG